MEFRIATFNCRDFFDDAVPHVIGQLDREGFGIWAQRRARTLFHRKLEAVAMAVARTDADVIAFQEIEGAHVLDALRGTLADGRYLPAVAGVTDSRGIACGLLSRFPISGVETHGAGELAFPVFAEGDPRPFGSRIQSKRGASPPGRAGTTPPRRERRGPRCCASPRPSTCARASTPG